MNQEEEIFKKLEHERTLKEQDVVPSKIDEENQIDTFVTSARSQVLAQSKEIEQETEKEIVEQEEAEESYADQLHTLRFLENTVQDIEGIRERGGSFGKPSKFKYLICGGIAALKDGLDILSLLGVATIPLWWLVGPFLSLVLILIFWFFNVKQKRAQEFMKSLENDLDVIQKNIAHTIRVASRVPGIKKKAANLAIVKISSFLKKNPTVKIAAGGAIDSIPLVNLVPFNLLAVVLSYLDERKIYKNAAQNAEEAYVQLSSQLTESI